MPAQETVRLKICGLHPDDDVEFTNADVVSHVGVVFVPTSRRFVRPETVRPLVGRVASGCRVMGVFVNDDFDSVMRALSVSGVHGAQFHGQESPAFCQSVRAAGCEVWKALSVPQPCDEAAIAALSRTIAEFQDCVDGLLLDAAPPKDAVPRVTGGHGQTFDWRMLPALYDAIHSAALPPIWVAGGLNPQNVAALLNVFRPAGIDVSSGVETAGRKSQQKIKEMIEAVSRHHAKRAVSR